MVGNIIGIHNAKKKLEKKVKKRILFLGTAHLQIPPLKYAQSQGH